MRTSSQVGKLIFCVILICFLASCTHLYPERWATVDEAYSSQTEYKITPEVPKDSYKQAVFNAPYADVFRAVEVAATQAGQNIESSNKSKGLILTTRGENRAWGTGPAKDRKGDILPGFFFYAITVKELDSRTTEVVIFSKAQRQSIRKIYTGLHWATGRDGDFQGLIQVINFTRNNLIAAGAL